MMGTRKTSFANGEFYHVFNRGVDKRTIFTDRYDVDRFFKSLIEFNAVDPIGSLYESSRNQCSGSTAIEGERLVNIIAYCLNPNHYHLILEQLVDGGLSEFMKRLGGYTWYFNNKYERSGSLFQGRFKARHIDSNEYLLHVSAYVNLNDRVHKRGGSTATPLESRSSWGEYTDRRIEGICEKGIILEQFRTIDEYKGFSSLEQSSKKQELKISITLH
jgi:REP element-mobilizing transposase RayT